MGINLKKILPKFLHYPERLFIAITTHVLTVYFFYNSIYVNEAYWLLAIAFGLFQLQAFTVSSFLHKGISHGHWKFKSKTIDVLLTSYLSVSGHMFPTGPIEWAIAHRLHHDHLDDKLDLHSPSQIGMFAAHFHLWGATVNKDQLNRKIYIDLLKNYKHLWVFSLYPKFIAFTLWSLIILFFGIEGLSVLAAASCLEFHGLGVIDAYAHKTKAKTRSIPWYLWVLSFGDPEGMYNEEHHAKPYAYSFNPGWLDYSSRFMELLGKIGVIEIKGKKLDVLSKTEI